VFGRTEMSAAFRGMANDFAGVTGGEFAGPTNWC
jgi:hypothetical protein